MSYGPPDICFYAYFAAEDLTTPAKVAGNAKFGFNEKGYGQVIKKQANMNETAKTLHERINRDQRWDKCLFFCYLM